MQELRENSPYKPREVLAGQDVRQLARDLLEMTLGKARSEADGPALDAFVLP